MQRRKKDGKLFLSFLNCKCRYNEVPVTFFNQPFDENTFNLVDDILCEKPAGLVSLTTDFEDVDLDLYKSRGRKVHVDGDVEILSDPDDLFSLKPVA